MIKKALDVNRGLLSFIHREQKLSQLFLLLVGLNCGQRDGVDDIVNQSATR